MHPKKRDPGVLCTPQKIAPSFGVFSAARPLRCYYIYDIYNIGHILRPRGGARRRPPRTGLVFCWLLLWRRAAERAPARRAAGFAGRLNSWSLNPDSVFRLRLRWPGWGRGPTVRTSGAKSPPRTLGAEPPDAPSALSLPTRPRRRASRQEPSRFSFAEIMMISRKSAG